MQEKNILASPVSRAIGYILLTAITIAGFWAIGDKLVEGPINDGTNQNVAWGLWVALYVFFLGLSAGSFLISTLIYVFKVKQLEEAGPTALVQALGCLILGGMLIVLDAGHPERIYYVVLHFNPTSAMAYLGVFYNLYIAVVIVELYFALRPRIIEKIQSGDQPAWLYRFLSLGSRRLDAASLARDGKWLMILGIIGIPTACIVHGGVGTIFALSKARASWVGPLFPFLFIVTALASGGALLTLLIAAFGKMPGERKLALVGSLAQLTMGVLILHAVLIFLELFVTSYSGNLAQVAGDDITLFGSYSRFFWVIEIGLGIVIPILLMALPWTRKRVSWLGLAGFLIVVGMLAERIDMIIPAQLTPFFAASVGAYNHLRYMYSYFPSTSDILVALGVFALGIWMIVLAGKYLPLEVSPHKSAPEGGALS